MPLFHSNVFGLHSSWVSLFLLFLSDALPTSTGLSAIFNDNRPALIRARPIPAGSMSKTNPLPSISLENDKMLSSLCECGAVEIQFPASSVTTKPIDNIGNHHQDRNNNDRTTTAAVDCHCPSCRKYHVAAFTSYVQVPYHLLKVVIDPLCLRNPLASSHDVLGTFRDYCSGSWGVPGASPIPVQRIYCKQCSSKMYTKPILESSIDEIKQELVFVNMGPLLDESIPSNLSLQWKLQKPNLRPLDGSAKRMEERIYESQYGRMQWKVSETAAWTWALPRYDIQKHQNDEEYDDNNIYNSGKNYKNEFEYAADDNGEEDDSDDNNFEEGNSGDFDSNCVKKARISTIMKGGCTCGLCRYELQFQAPTEIQHCYCTICRNLSGSAFMSWIPIELSLFRWTSTVDKIIIDNKFNSVEQQQFTKKSSFPYSSSGSRTVNATSSFQTEENLGANHLLVRYTGHAQRHVCTECRSAISIRYDLDGTDVLWIAAATLDTIHIPSVYRGVDRYLERVVHICCGSKQSWYELPDDGMARIDEAC